MVPIASEDLVCPEFFGGTAFVLAIALIFPPKRPIARFFVRQLLTMMVISLWSVNVGYAAATNGYEGFKSFLFFLFVLPLVSALHPQKIGISISFLGMIFFLISALTIKHEMPKLTIQEIGFLLEETITLRTWCALPGLLLIAIIRFARDIGQKPRKAR